MKKVLIGVSIFLVAVLSCFAIYGIAAKKANLAKQEAAENGYTVSSAYASYKKGLYPEVIRKCHKIIEVDSKNPKPYLLKAQAELKLLDFAKAYEDLEKAHKLDPKNKRIEKMYTNVGKNKILKDPKALERAKKVGYAKYLKTHKNSNPKVTTAAKKPVQPIKSAAVKKQEQPVKSAAKK